MTNLEGGRVFADTWKALDQVDLQAYMGLLILAGENLSNHEATKSLWDGVREAYIPVNYVPAAVSRPLKSFQI